MKLLIYEDGKFDNFYPLTYLRASWELRCGAFSLRQRIEQLFPGVQVGLWARDLLVPVLRRRYPNRPVNDLDALKGDDVLLVNGRALLTGPVDVRDIGAVKSGEELVYALLPKEKAAECSGLEDLLALAESLPSEQKDVRVVQYLWDLVSDNPNFIERDFDRFGPKVFGKLHPTAVVYGPEDRVYIGEGAEVHPYVVLDTRGGPVIVDRGVEVHPFTRIEGPSYIGPDCILLGAKIREGCSFGPVCRIGGEVEESIVQGYSNKYHDGFLGHAYVGEWVNLGALTTNSDLKNDYSTVQVYLKGQLVDTGELKVGAFIGDHTKTSIGTLLNTGTTIGIMCNIVGAGALPPKYVPPFSLFVNGKIMKGFGFKYLLETARTAMSRRKIELSPEEEVLLKAIYDATKGERAEAVKKYR